MEDAWKREGVDPLLSQGGLVRLGFCEEILIELIFKEEWGLVEYKMQENAN